MNPAQPNQSSATGWPKAVMWICIVAIVAGSGIYVFKSCIEAPAKIVGGVADRVSKAARELASAFVQGNVSTEFREFCTEVHPNLALQVATLKETEQFTRSDEAAVGSIPLPEVVVSVTAPVEYTYYLSLDEKWQFNLKDNVLTVYAPNPKANKPSFDVSNMEWEVKKDSLIRRTSQVKEDLKRSLMPLAASRARAHMGLVKETARAQVSVFVERWIAERFTDGKKYQVRIYFENERGQEKVLFKSPTG